LPDLNLPTESQITRRLPANVLLLAVLSFTFLAYVSTLQFQFVYDDESQIVGNQLIQQWRFVPYYFHMQVWAHANPHLGGNYYRPIFMLWLRSNHALFGYHALAWHLTTVLLHVAATFAVFRLAQRLGRREDIAAITALIFGLHPVHLEVAAWVSGLTESLLAIFLIASFLCYLHYRDGRRSALIYSLILFFGAILTKETGIVLPLLIAAYEWIYPRDERPSWAARFWRAARSIIPYLALCGIYLYLRYLSLGGALLHRMHPISLHTSLLTIPSILWFYIKLLIAPFGLSAFYDTPYITEPTLRQFVLPLVAVLLVAAGLIYWYQRTRDRLIAFAIACLVIPLLPLMNFSVFSEGEIAHDRYLYLPSFGFALLVAIAITRLAPQASTAMDHDAGSLTKPVVLGTTAVIACAFLALTVWQSLFWASNLVLYRRGVEIAPLNNTAMNNLAIEFENRHLYPQAIGLHEQVLSRNPNFYLSIYNLGYIYNQSGDWQRCSNFLRRAAMLDANDSDTFFYLGQCELKLGHLDVAEASFRRAIALDPRVIGPRYYLGLVLKQKNRPQEALDLFRAELAKNPADPNSRAEVEALTGK
jgi:tetratricopeptide (TPR) repeat protein